MRAGTIAASVTAPAARSAVTGAIIGAEKDVINAAISADQVRKATHRSRATSNHAGVSPAASAATGTATALVAVNAKGNRSANRENHALASRRVNRARRANPASPGSRVRKRRRQPTRRWLRSRRRRARAAKALPVRPRRNAKAAVVAIVDAAATAASRVPNERRWPSLPWPTPKMH